MEFVQVIQGRVSESEKTEKNVDSNVGYYISTTLEFKETRSSVLTITNHLRFRVHSVGSPAPAKEKCTGIPRQEKPPYSEVLSILQLDTEKDYK